MLLNKEQRTLKTGLGTSEHEKGTLNTGDQKPHNKELGILKAGSGSTKQVARNLENACSGATEQGTLNTCSQATEQETLKTCPWDTEQETLKTCSGATYWTRVRQEMEKKRKTMEIAPWRNVLGKRGRKDGVRGGVWRNENKNGRRYISDVSLIAW